MQEKLETSQSTAPDESADGNGDHAGIQQLNVHQRSIRRSLAGIFVLLLMAALYIARDFVFPILLALVLYLTLRPIARFLARRHIPPAVTAVFLSVSLAAAVVVAIYALLVPAAEWIDRAPEIRDELQQKLADLRAPMEAISEAEDEIEKATTSDDTGARTVVVEGPGMLTSAAGGLLAGLVTVTIALVLLTLFLATGDMFYQKLVQSFDTLKDKKKALGIAHDVEREVSRYLFTITLVNIGLGIVVGSGLYALGMPSAHIWGAVAALANFLPYIGAIVGVAAATAVALVSFDTIGQALLIPAFYLACTTIEGNFVTPYIVGRRLELNIVAVFIAVAFWAWLWGIAGALLAVPILVIVKTICDHVPRWNKAGNFLSSAGPSADPD